MSSKLFSAVFYFSRKKYLPVPDKIYSTVVGDISSKGSDRSGGNYFPSKPQHRAESNRGRGQGFHPGQEHFNKR